MNLKRLNGTAAVCLLLGVASSSNAFGSEVLAVRGNKVYTMAGAALNLGVVIVRDGRIAAVGPADSVVVPPGARVLEAAVVTPGLIDAHSTVGLSGLLNQPHDQDQLERSEAIQPELRAIDAYNARDPLVDWIRGLGFTTLHTGHAPGALVAGQTMIAKTWPPNADQAILNSAAMIAVTLGPGAVNSADQKPPGTAAKSVAMLRSELIKAVEYARKRASDDPEKRPDRNLRLETLQSALEGKMPLLITAHRHLDILAAIRLAREFKVRLVLDGVADAPWVLDEIRTGAFPVFIHPAMARAHRELENASFETPARLKEAGIPFAFQSGYESYVPKTRVALFEAAIAVANGLSFDDALAALTRDSARLLGVADRIGSLEPGKDADLALFDGDPFEYTTRCVAVVVSGVVTDTTPR